MFASFNQTPAQAAALAAVLIGPPALALGIAAIWVWRWRTARSDAAFGKRGRTLLPWAWNLGAAGWALARGDTPFHDEAFRHAPPWSALFLPLLVGGVGFALALMAFRGAPRLPWHGRLLFAWNAVLIAAGVLALALCRLRM